MGAERGQHKQANATYDEYVCQIERRPMICSPVEIKEIHHRTNAHAIYYIAHRAADNSDVGNSIQTTMHAPLEKNNKASTHKQTQRSKNVPLPTACTGEKRKCCARIESMYQIKDGRHLNFSIQR